MTQDAHIIRLRGPWRWENATPAGRDGSPNMHGAAGAAPGFVTRPMPFCWAELGETNAAGHVRGVRGFGRPTGLAATDRVELVIAPCDWQGRVRLNDRELGELPPRGSTSRFDVTQLLLPRNVVELQIDPPGGEASCAKRLDFDVRLEIHAANP